MTSYHRVFNLYNMYKGPVSLKMYPTMEKSDWGEFNRIIQKYMKVYEQNKICRYIAYLKKKTMSFTPPLKNYTLAITVTHSPPK